VSHNTEGRATLTRLGRAVHAGGGAAGTAQPRHREEHRQANWLRDVILGGQDGLVNILGIILGVIAGGGWTGWSTPSPSTATPGWPP